MKKILFICCFFLITVNVFGQQYSQYNTGSLYESFENPSQRTFIPDTTKQFAFNFLIPNFGTNFYVTGNVQVPLRSREFSSYYNTKSLDVGKGSRNYLNLNANFYWLMFKMFASADGNQELGVSFSTKTELRGVITDETAALFNGYLDFPNNSYSNIFNNNAFYQAYHQIGFTYREQVTNRFAFGVKLSALSGITYRKYNIIQSGINFDKPNDAATIALQGTAYTNSTRSQTDAEKILPTFLNPGAAISISTSYLDESGYKWQGNIKDVGFIHWNNQSKINYFNGSALIENISGSNREDAINKGAEKITDGNTTISSFTSRTNGLLELSVNKSYLFGGDEDFKFSPTLIASKELFYSGFTGALVAPVQFNRYTVSLTSSYNDMKLFNLGGQFMIKNNNSEFFIGTERLWQTGSLIVSTVQGSSGNQNQFAASHGAFTGMDFFIGVSFKFGSIIESKMNESSVPDGDKGFIGKLWEKIFKKDKNY